MIGMRRLRLPAVPKVRVRVNVAVAQLVAACVAMLVGAALIGGWMVGVVLMVGGVLVGVDAVLRDTDSHRPAAELSPLERYRRAR